MRRNQQILFSLIFLVFGLSVFADDNKKETPNIIIIYADDLGLGDVGCYNTDCKIPTPNIDKLAKNGVLFLDAHAGSAICSPSRYAILTGSYSWRTNRKKGNPAPGEQSWIGEGRTTIASMLKENGYNTATIGKWGLGADWANAARTNRKGLDISSASIDYSRPVFSGKPVGFTYEAVHLWYGYNYYKKHYPCYEEPGIKEKYDGGRWYFENGISRDGDPQFEKFDMEEAQLYYINKTVKYIDAAGGRVPDSRFNLKEDSPFFIYYAPHIPHYPLVPAKQFQGKTSMGLYGDFIYELDWAVGQIVEALERNKMLDNTIIIFTSDNGPETQTYGYIQKYQHRSMGSLRGVKRDLWEGGHTTPFIVSFPGKFATGRRTDRLVSQTDLLATIADLLDIKPGKRFAEDSYSFLDELIGERNVDKKRNIVIHHSASGKLALRKNEWVFIYSPTGDENKEPAWFREELGVKQHSERFELFNLEDDPSQTVNLVAEYPQIVKEMLDELFKYVYEGRTVMRD